MQFNIIDSVFLAFLVYLLLKGYLSGIILMAADILGNIIAYIAALIISKNLSAYVAETLVAPLVEDFIRGSVINLPIIKNIEHIDINTEAISSAYEKIQELLSSINFNINIDAIDFSSISSTALVDSIVNAITGSLTQAIAYFICFTVVFAIVNMLIHVIANSINILTKVVKLNLVSRILGAVLGAAEAIVLTIIALWVVNTFMAGFVPTILQDSKINQVYTSFITE